MTATHGTRAAPWRQDLTAAHHALNPLFGWDVNTGPDGLTVNAGTGFDALTLPAKWSLPLLAALRAGRLSTPILADVTIARWTVFARLHGTRADVPFRLRGARVCAVPRGTPVRLPVPHFGKYGPLHWVIAPRVCERQVSWPVAVDLVRRGVGGNLP